MNRITRRTVLALGLKSTGAALAVAGLAACAKQETAALSCADPNSLTASETSLRQASQYVVKAPDPAKNCAGCAFFTADAAAKVCGQCQILSGTVDATGHCTSWAAKPAA